MECREANYRTCPLNRSYGMTCTKSVGKIFTIRSDFWSFCSFIDRKSTRHVTFWP